MHELRIVLLAVLCLPILVLAVLFFVHTVRLRLPKKKPESDGKGRRK
jgi:hypothetical protein